MKSSQILENLHTNNSQLSVNMQPIESWVHMKTNKLTHNWLLDAVLFTVFLVAFFLDLTGVILHQYLGILCGILILIHFLWHFRWVSTVARSFFTITSKRTLLYFLLDALILIGVLVIIINGLVISTWF
jgi:hypothetical protein